MRRKIFFTIFAFSFATSVSFGQSTQYIGSMEIQANINFENHEFYKALKLFLKLDSLQPNSNKYNYEIGVCYVNQLKNDKAIPYLEKCLEHPEIYPRNLDYYAAKAYQLSHKFDEAITHYEIYLHKLKKKNKDLIKDVNKEIESCKYAKEQIAKAPSVKVINLGETINTEYPDYGPVLSADQQTLIFTSARPNTTGKQMDETDGRYFEDIYISHRTETGWSAPESIGTGINTDANDASISLSPDGQKLLIYRNSHNFMNTETPGDLYVSRLKGSTWTQATKLSENINSKAWEPSACYSADERSMFFASNKEGGKGGTDLYMIKMLPNGEWALPMNLGNKINTPYDEDAPFIHPDGKTLYFSSNGHKTMGGFDIFVSRYNEETKEWSTPENLGYPINTAQDDIHFSLSADGRRVYFSSTRPEGKGDNDIYYADLNKEAAKVVVIKGAITDAASNSAVEATITVFDNQTNELKGIYNSNSSTGKYLIILTEDRKYNITVEAANYQLYFENFDASTLDEFEEITKNITVRKKE